MRPVLCVGGGHGGYGRVGRGFGGSVLQPGKCGGAPDGRRHHLGHHGDSRRQRLHGADADGVLLSGAERHQGFFQGFGGIGHRRDSAGLRHPDSLWHRCGGGNLRHREAGGDHL